uniref:26S proteasome complex subunit SEM1 n=1 Tax=Equus caballus TaxID=9796 RepID=A0A5F5PRL6_HORSE
MTHQPRHAAPPQECPSGSAWALTPHPALDWAGLDEDEDAHVWEDNWDDDNVEDDFSNQLRAELEKHGYKMETS